MAIQPRQLPAVLPFLIVVVGCSDTQPPSPPEAASITLSATSVSLKSIGETVQITATAKDKGGVTLSVPINWTVSDPGVATVSSSGVVTAVRNGTASITVTSASATAAIPVTVVQEPAQVAITPATPTLTSSGATVALTAVVRDAGGAAVSGATVEWSSSDNGVATVSSAGVATAVANGKATITATAGAARGTVVLSVDILPELITVVRPVGIRDTIRGAGVRFQLRATQRDAKGQQVPVAGARWSSSNSDVATIDVSSGIVRTLAAGRVDFTVTAGGASGIWNANVERVRRITVDPYLATPLSGAQWEVPVVLIEFLPTADGFNLDTLKAPGFGGADPMSLDSAQAYVLKIAKRRKMSVEHGTRFRGYRDAAALPSLGYRVVEHIIVYDQIPPHPTKRATNITGQPRFEGWHAVFADLGLEALVRARTVRELWVAWSSFDGNYPVYKPGIFSVDDMRAGWESNMSSPTTGDISNSDRDPTDAPVLGHTYIIYGINFRRTQAEAVHNVGHQLEAMMAYVATRQDGNDRLFWRDFVGQDAQRQFITGRAGWTHMPPNTTADYDYLNASLVSSDIEDWRPDNGGQKKSVNVNTWGALAYPWPGEAEFGQRSESQWYTYWFQSFAGRGNRIPHGANWMTNWWAFVADWDGAINSRLGLYAAGPAAAVGTYEAYRYPAPTTLHDVPERRAPLNPTKQ